MIAQLLETSPTAELSSVTRDLTLYPDVLPTFMALSHVGSANLVQLLPMPDGHEELLPPFAAQVHSIEQIDRDGLAGDDIVLVASTMENFALAQSKGWLTVWLNRDRSANMTGVLPDAEIHSLLDLPDVVESMQEARARANALLENGLSFDIPAAYSLPPLASS